MSARDSIGPGGAGRTSYDLDRGLIKAAKYRDVGVVAELLDRGANINAKYCSLTALHRAVKHGNTDVVRLLIKRGQILMKKAIMLKLLCITQLLMDVK